MNTLEKANYLSLRVSANTITKEDIVSFVEPLVKSEFRRDELIKVVEAVPKLKVLRPLFIEFLKSLDIEVLDDEKEAKKRLVLYHLNKIANEDLDVVKETHELIEATNFDDNNWLGPLYGTWNSYCEIDSYIKYTPKKVTKEDLVNEHIGDMISSAKKLLHDYKDWNSSSL